MAADHLTIGRPSRNDAPPVLPHNNRCRIRSGLIDRRTNLRPARFDHVPDRQVSGTQFQRSAVHYRSTSCLQDSRVPRVRRADIRRGTSTISDRQTGNQRCRTCLRRNVMAEVVVNT